MTGHALGGSTPPVVTTGGEYACRERVLAPPTGTLDVDWVTPAVLEAHPELDQPAARAVVEHVWRTVRQIADEQGVPVHAVTADAVRDRIAAHPAAPTGAAAGTATGVVLDAIRLFGVA